METPAAMTIPTALAAIRNAEALQRDIRHDIADQWKLVGSMLRDIRRNKRLTQQQAAALIARDASVVLRWEKGCAVDATEVMDYLAKLETN
jgi:ribosome-binding protein aMBF1 (putative translation factor)